MKREINIGFGISLSVVHGTSGVRVSLDNSVADYTRVITPLGDYKL